MTLATCIALALSIPHGYDARLPVAWAYTYCLGRPLYIIGYLLDPKTLGRVPGLMLGGFWTNLSVFVYLMMGDRDQEAWIRIYYGIPRAVAAIVALFVSYYPMKDDPVD